MTSNLLICKSCCISALLSPPSMPLLLIKAVAHLVKPGLVPNKVQLPNTSCYDCSVSSPLSTPKCWGSTGSTQLSETFRNLNSPCPPWTSAESNMSLPEDLRWKRLKPRLSERNEITERIQTSQKASANSLELRTTFSCSLFWEAGDLSLWQDYNTSENQQHSLVSCCLSACVFAWIPLSFAVRLCLQGQVFHECQPTDCKQTWFVVGFQMFFDCDKKGCISDNWKCVSCIGSLYFCLGKGLLQ